jgi:hypothetical protein
MPRYFFHTEDGETILDSQGMELPDLKAARAEAIRTCGEMLCHIPSAIDIDNGYPFRVWVTDQPSGGGSKMFTITVATENG